MRGYGSFSLWQGMSMLNLDVSIRDDVAQRTLQALAAAAPGSTCELRGSLATGMADAYSDIDLLWTIPDKDFALACDAVESALSTVARIDNVRLDPEAAAHPARRLVFARFADMPLFWRVDLDMRSALDDPAVTAPPTTDFSRSATHSALMNAIAAIKALLRNQPDEAAGLLSRAYERIHVPAPVGEPHVWLVDLVDTIYDADDEQALLAERIRQLYRDAFGSE